MCQFVEGVHTTLPYALAVFLVRSMLQQKGGEGEVEGNPNLSPLPPSESLVGWTTGALAACWSLAQFCTSMLWGRVSDAGLGRRPLLAMSAVSSGVSVLFFGSSRSLAAAAISRLAGGAFNCTFVALKCVIAESSPRGVSQSGPMSVLALAWGCGTIVGPALGALADPCRRGGWVSRSAALCRSVSAPSSDPASAAAKATEGLFRRHPYLFPCVAAAILSAAAVVNVTLVMKETLPSLVEERRERRQRQKEEPERRGASFGSLALRRSLSSRVLGGALSRSTRSLRRVMTFSSPYALVGAGALGGNGNNNGGGENNSGGGGGGESGGGALELSKLEGGAAGEHSGLLAASPQQRCSPSASPSPAKRREQPRAPPSAFASSRPAAGDEAAEQGKSSAFGKGGDGTPPSPPPSSPPRQAEPPLTTTPWHQLPQVRLTLCGYGCVAFLFNLLDELVPIFASAAEKDGGLGWDPAQLAPPLAVGGLALILWSQLGYHRLQRKVGTLRAARCGLAGMAPFCLLLAAPSLARQGLPRASSLSLLLCLRSVFANNAFTSSMVLVNEAAPRESIGLVNGAGQTLASFVRAVGPALGGGLWGFASTSLRPPLGQFLPFFLVSIGLVASSLVYTKVLPPLGELAAWEEKEEEERAAAYQLVSSAAEAATAAGDERKNKAPSLSSSSPSSRSPVLFGDDNEDCAADGAVKVVVVALPN